MVVPGLTAPGPRQVDDLLPVDGPVERLAEGHVLEHRVAAAPALVAVQGEVVPGEQAVGDGRDPLGGLELGELRRGDAPGRVEVPREEVLGHGVRVLIGDEEDLVDGRLLAPERGVGDHAHVVALLDLRHLEGPRADDGRLALVGGAGRLGAHLAPDVLGQDGDPGADHVGLGLAAADLDGEVVDGHRLVDERREAREGAHLVVDDVVVGERHVVGGERLTVLPLDALAQVEGPDLAVRGGLPGGGEVRRGLQIGRVAGEEVVVEQPDLVGRGLGPDERVEVVGVVGPADVQDHLVAGRRGARVGRQRGPEPRRQTGGQQAGDEQKQEKTRPPMAAAGLRHGVRHSRSPLIRPPRRPRGRRPDDRPPRALLGLAPGDRSTSRVWPAAGVRQGARPHRWGARFAANPPPTSGTRARRAGRRQRPSGHNDERPAASREAAGRRPGAL